MSTLYGELNKLLHQKYDMCQIICFQDTVVVIMDANTLTSLPSR